MPARLAARCHRSSSCRLSWPVVVNAPDSASDTAAPQPPARLPHWAVSGSAALVPSAPRSQEPGEPCPEGQGGSERRHRPLVQQAALRCGGRRRDRAPGCVGGHRVVIGWSRQWNRRHDVGQTDVGQTTCRGNRRHGGGQTAASPRHAARACMHSSRAQMVTLSMWLAGGPLESNGRPRGILRTS